MGKNIVVCCDGTGNKYGRNNTNVVHLFEAIVRDDRQTAFYDPGVGTFSVFGREFPKIGLLLGQGFGYGLTENIEDAYKYLMDAYAPDDRLYLFGFSRGAFTVRCLAGMLKKCGLLERGSLNLVPYASEIYNTHDNDDVAQGFKSTYCRECKPYFIGVWDTVGSLGHVYARKKFFNPRLNSDITFGYQAMAIDEKRKKFPVSIWNEARKAPHQTIEQVWFAGVHSDVGGWYDERDLSDISLMWMLEKAEAKGLILREGWRNGLKPNHKGMMHESRVGFWRLWKPVVRQIPENSLMHESVIQRKNANMGYSPQLPKTYKVVG